MSNIHLDSIATYGGCIETIKKVDPSLMFVSSYEETTQFINGIYSTDLNVVLRSGAVVKSPSNPPYHTQYNNSFVVRKTYRIDYLSYYTFIDSLSKVQDSDVNETSMIRVFKQKIHELGETSKHSSASTFTISVDIGFTKNDLMRAGSSIYLHEADIVIYDPKRHERVLHPYSEEFLKKARVECNRSNMNTDDFYYRMEIIDNLGSIGTRYVKIGSDVHSVKSKIDNLRMDGVYITKTLPTKGSYTYTEITETFYTIEDAEKEFSLYRHFEQAKHSQEDQTFIRKEKLSEIEHETAKIKAETAQQTAKTNKFKAFVEENDAYIKIGILVLGIIASTIALIKKPEIAGKVISAAAK